MQIDLAKEALDTVKCDVAIIGAGAAGITMARRLSSANRHVVLIESGGLDYEKDTAALNAGSSIGQSYYELEESRLRFFGGTTAIWGGRCAQLDSIDFDRRSWVPNSGWPISLNDLEPWYSEARKLLDIDATADPEELFGVPVVELAVRCWSFDRKFDRFGFKANRSLVNSTNVTLLLHATVRELVPSASGQEIIRLEVLGPGSKRLEIVAKTYVLAAGGLENPRILLASNSVAKHGVGNDNDLVGRFFMEHPHARGGAVKSTAVWKLLGAFKRQRINGVEFAPLLTPSFKLQRREQLLNSAITLAARPPETGSHRMTKRLYLRAKHEVEPTKAGRNLWRTYRRAMRALQQLAGPISSRHRVQQGKMELAIVVRAEQSPNPESRVLLDRETDALGMPRIRLDWRLQQLDIHTVSRMVDALDRDLARLNLGRAAKSDWLKNGLTQWVTDSLVSAHPIGGYHHMGTTRMANDPSQGVTDQWGRVHGVANLYVAGSSLFPTSGWANPTLTILALALRTCEKILQDR